MEPLGPCQTLHDCRLEQQVENPSNPRSEVSVTDVASSAMISALVVEIVWEVILTIRILCMVYTHVVEIVWCILTIPISVFS